MAVAFSAPFQMVQWIALGYLLALTTVIAGAGRWGDLIGRRRLLLAGMAVFTASSAVSGVAPTLWLLIAARVAQGLGAAVMMALSVSFITDTVPRGETGRAMGLLGTMSAVGTTLGPSLGGFLIAAFGWRSIFLVNVPLGLANLYLASRSLPPDRRPAGRGRTGFDLAGMTALALALAAYALAMTLGRGEFGLLNAGLLAGAVAAGVVFVRVERRAAAPLIAMALFRDRVLRTSLGSSVLVATVMMSTLVVGPFYLTRGLGLGAAAAGLVLAAGPLAAALAGIPAGRMVDRFGPGRMAMAGLSGVSAGCGMVALAPEWLGVAGYVLPLLVVTASYALFQAANNTRAMTHVGAERRGLASGLMSLSRNLGLITGAAGMGAVYGAAGMRATYVAGALLAASALLFRDEEASIPHGAGAGDIFARAGQEE